MKRFTIFLFLTLMAFNLEAQEYSREKPKLVVGVVVDQMRYDYLTRFWDRFGKDGFKKLVNEGFNFKNHHYNYVPTYTGPGHASIYTGTSPMNHGIISNNWYDKTNGEFVYCASDPKVNPVGTNSDAGKMSPRRMLSTTVADQNRLNTEMRGKTIGVSLKDRASILPAGHAANAAYWFHGKGEGKWITSSYYMEKLPQWVIDFNKSGKAASYLKSWNTLYDIDTYAESGSDVNNFEGGFKGKKTASFPYDLAKLKDENGGYDILKSTPFGNDLTLDFAMAAIEGEQLGVDKDTDFLTLSFSTTDYVGHNFGVNSKEVEDTYLRLDKTLGRLLKYLDEKVGKGNYTLFLTADHGGVNVPAYLQSAKIPAGYFDDKAFGKRLKSFVNEEFGVEDLISSISNGQVFLDYGLMNKEDLEAEDVEQRLAAYILQQDKIARVYTRSQMMNGNYTKGVAAAIQNGFNQKRSGDVIFVLEPATISYSHTGSTHGSDYSYDTHVPLLFYGKGIEKGETTSRSEVIDIAPTVSAILGIAAPNATTGHPLYIMLDRKKSE